MRKLIYLLLFSTGMLAGCIEKFDADLPASEQGWLVLEGNIVADSDVTFSLSKTFPLSEEVPPEGYNEVKATICVVGSNGYRSKPGVEIAPGQYRVAVGALDDDEVYWMEMECDGDTFRSEAESPLYTPAIDSVSFRQEGYGDIEFRVSTHDPGMGKQYYTWNFEEDWEIAVRFDDVRLLYVPEENKVYDIKVNPYRYCWNRNVSSRVLIGNTEALSENRIVNRVFHSVDPASEKVQELYCITLKQRAISKKAYDYYENKQKLGEEMGGLFTPQPSELSGNIVCTTNPARKVIGYVGVAHNVTYYRKFVAKAELSIPGRLRCQEPVNTIGLRTFRDYYMAGYRPIWWKVALPPLQPEYAPSEAYWSQADCVDCRTNGGTKNKPDFWPNDHE